MTQLEVFLQSQPIEEIKAFMNLVCRIVEAGLVPTAEGSQASAPGQTDYAHGSPQNSTPAGGWLSDSEVRATAQAMTEAISAEKWVDGFLFAVKIIAAMSGGL